MTTDAELRRLAEAACREPDRYGQANCELHETIGGGVVLSLLDRLAVAEKRAAEAAAKPELDLAALIRQAVKDEAMYVKGKGAK